MAGHDRAKGEELSGDNPVAQQQELEYDKYGIQRLTPQEEAVLSECRQQAILYRGLPLGIISVFITRRAATVAPHISRWRGFYYTGVFFLSLLTGVASYRRQCIIKIMQLENSPLADRLREQLKGRSPYQRLHQWQEHQMQQQEGRDRAVYQQQDSQRSYTNQDSSYGMTTSSVTSSSSKNDNYLQDNELPAFQDRPVRSSTLRKDNESSSAPPALWDQDEKSTTDQSQNVSYSELRQRNRQVWAEGEQGKSQVPSGSTARQIDESSNRFPTRRDTYQRQAKTNQYGDIIDE